MKKLTIQEEEVMQAIWAIGSGVIKDFISKLDQSDKIPYTTVASIVRNLEKKGYVESKRYGNTNVFTPKIHLSDYKREFMGTVVKDYFTNSYKDMVAFFVKEKRLSKDELEEIIELIESNNE
ncbi:MAG: BlaI/MecI/CopY family transcriptional regulator [Rikenellaceae bacterium]